jgi:hypothetical protein
MKTYWVSWGVSPRIFDLSAVDGGEWSASRLGRFTPKERAPAPLGRMLFETQSQSGCGDEKKNSQPIPGLILPIIQPLAERCTTEPGSPKHERRK